MRRFLLLSFIATACAGATETLVPTERVDATVDEGIPAAVYDITIDGQHMGSATVSSRGAYHGDLAGEKRTLVHTAIDLENTGNVPMTIDSRHVSLQSVTINEQTLTGIPPVSLRGDTQIEPGQSGHVDIYFALPRGVSPEDVDGVHLAWSAATSVGRYAEVTPFREFEPYAYYTPYYDPFGYPGFYYERYHFAGGYPYPFY